VYSPVWNATAVLNSAAPAAEMAAIASRIVSPESHVSSTINTRWPRTSFGALPNTSGVSRTLLDLNFRLTTSE